MRRCFSTTSAKQAREVVKMLARHDFGSSACFTVTLNEEHRCCDVMLDYQAYRAYVAKLRSLDFISTEHEMIVMVACFANGYLAGKRAAKRNKTA